MLARYYIALKTVHVAAVALSIGLFLFRAGLRIAGSSLLETRLLRIAPHLIDTVLLASAVLLTLILHQYPFANDWLTAKVIALVAYIVLGSIALRRGRTPAIRAIALVAALLTVGYILGTALHHDANPLRW